MHDDTAPAPDDRRGTLGLGPDGEWQIRFERRLPHPPARVWSALTDPAQQGEWLPGVTLRPEPGSTVTFDFGDEGRAEGAVLAVEPGRLVEHTWLWPGETESRVRWELSPDGDGTRLVLLHRPVRREPAADYRAGWHAMLDSLHAHLTASATPSTPAAPDTDSAPGTPPAPWPA
ncbi:SRPBCC family protein [Nonomuraea sp. NPDC049725]|uniref:SRPBCC family protein n=1 Tax=Nonomuraea sp. NPDC049725 TaxID=3154508 RepID=UPI003435A0F6